MDDLLNPPSGNQKSRIEELAGYGASEEDIAAELKIPLQDLREHYHDELTYGKAKGRNEVLKTFYNQVRSGTHVNSLSLWVKSQCGWRDTGASTTTTVPQINVKIVAPESPCTPSR